MIDIHCHILPALDDGSDDMKETTKMLEKAVKEGIHTIIATPHFEVGADEHWSERYQCAFAEVQNYVQQQELPIDLYQGSEVFYSEGILNDEIHEHLVSMNQTRYILVEFPLHESFGAIQRAVANLCYAGWWPILAHVERYESLKNIRNIKELADMGAYIQVNTSSMAGDRGWLTQFYCLRLMKKDLLHFVATDAHGSKHRAPKAKNALHYMEKKMGKSYTRKITEKNPQKLMKGIKIRGEN